jgi:hypothetical protein
MPDKRASDAPELTPQDTPERTPQGEPANTASPPEGAQAAATPPDQQRQGALGMQLPQMGEIGGGAVVREIFPDDTPGTDPNHILNLQRLAGGSQFAKQIGLHGRSVDDWGLVGKCDDPDCRGDTWRGHGILLDINSLEKVRVHDGAVLREGLFVNTRNFAHGVMAGDVKENLR